MRFEDLRRDAHHGLRLLGRQWRFTLVAALTLALGIGATSAIFSVLNASVLAPLPFRDPGRLVFIEQVDGQGRERGIGVDTLALLRDESATLEQVSHSLMGVVNFTVSSRCSGAGSARTRSSSRATRRRRSSSATACGSVSSAAIQR
jgi:hypothetical protein